jgi:flagellar protein FlaI
VIGLGLLDRFRKKDEEEYELRVDQGVEILDFKRKYEVIDDYYVHKPIAKVKIVKHPELGEGLHYYVDEVPLNEEEYDSYTKILNILSKEMAPPDNMNMSPEEYVYDQAGIVAEKYFRALGQFTEAGWNKLFYYVIRELAGYAALHAIMLDPNIEDVSYNGLDMPIYVWHRKHESIPTNIRFLDEQTANDFLVKLAHKCSKHISSATPLMDGMLPEKHRLAATFMKEVSQKGSTFCIRKFRSDPFSIVDLINVGTLNERIAAYFWMILEYKQSFMIIGGTGAGKTSMLNGLLSLMSQNDKIVTVEEVPELSPPMKNWTQLNSRESFQFGEGAAASIQIFDLVKVSLRYRPDYIIVGEVRGEEAYTLFQALATGHGGLCTMHADSITNVVKRLTSPPMNVAKVYIPLMNSALHVQRVELPKPVNGLNFGRRVRTIWEIEDFDQYREVAVWNPRTDEFETWFEDSYLLEKVASISGKTKQDLLRELDERTMFLKNMIAENVRDQKLVAQKILSYYGDQREPVKKSSKKRTEKKDPEIDFTPDIKQVPEDSVEPLDPVIVEGLQVEEPVDELENMKSLLLDGEFDLSSLPELGKSGTSKLGELLEKDEVAEEVQVE